MYRVYVTGMLVLVVCSRYARRGVLLRSADGCYPKDGLWEGVVLLFMALGSWESLGSFLLHSSLVHAGTGIVPWGGHGCGIGHIWSLLWWLSPLWSWLIGMHILWGISWVLSRFCGLQWLPVHINIEVWVCLSPFSLDFQQVDPHHSRNIISFSLSCCLLFVGALLASLWMNLSVVLSLHVSITQLLTSSMLSVTNSVRVNINSSFLMLISKTWNVISFEDTPPYWVVVLHPLSRFCEWGR